MFAKLYLFLMKKFNLQLYFFVRFFFQMSNTKSEFSYVLEVCLMLLYSLKCNFQEDLIQTYKIIIKMIRIIMTSWLHLCTLCCTGLEFTFIGWLCSTEPISSIAARVSKYGGEQFLGKQLSLVPTQDPRQIFRQARLKGLLMFLNIIFMLFP